MVLPSLHKVLLVRPCSNLSCRQTIKQAESWLLTSSLPWAWLQSLLLCCIPELASRKKWHLHYCLAAVRVRKSWATPYLL